MNSLEGYRKSYYPCTVNLEGGKRTGKDITMNGWDELIMVPVADGESGLGAKVEATMRYLDARGLEIGKDFKRIIEVPVYGSFIRSSLRRN